MDQWQVDPRAEPRPFAQAPTQPTDQPSPISAETPRIDQYRRSSPRAPQGRNARSTLSLVIERQVSVIRSPRLPCASALTPASSWHSSVNLSHPIAPPTITRARVRNSGLLITCWGRVMAEDLRSRGSCASAARDETSFVCTPLNRSAQTVELDAAYARNSGRRPNKHRSRTFGSTVSR